MFNLSDINKEVLINAGAFGYSKKEIFQLLQDVDIKEIKKDFKFKNSEIKKLIKKGMIMRNYVLDKKLFELAKSGDMKAYDTFSAQLGIRKLKKK